MTQHLGVRHDTYTSVLGNFRIVIGLLFALHGASKLFGWPTTKMGAIPTGD
jgi:putative oxidoreductase